MDDLGDLWRIVVSTGALLKRKYERHVYQESCSVPQALLTHAFGRKNILDYLLEVMIRHADLLHAGCFQQKLTLFVLLLCHLQDPMKLSVPRATNFLIHGLTREETQ